MLISYSPIGVIRSPYKNDGDAPHYFLDDERTEATLEVDPRYLEGIADMAAGERYMVLFHLDRVGESPLTVTTCSGEVKGVFSTHSPRRPNPIGVSVITVRAVEGNIITFTGCDMLDGTPVLDIKSYRPAYTE